MLPGPDKVVACPHCGEAAKYPTTVSGNTFGARLWTDGRRIAPMLPQPPAVVKCRHCAGCYWLESAEELGQADPHQGSGSGSSEWADAGYVEEPSEEEYYKAIERGLATSPHEERRLRILAWWRSNDPDRTSPPGEATESRLSPARRQNLEALAALLEDDEEVTAGILRAEVFRALGRFREAEALLRELEALDHQKVVAQILALCEKGDAVVRELRLPG